MKYCNTLVRYAAFVASDSVIKQIPRILGPGLNTVPPPPNPPLHPRPHLMS